MTNDIKYLVFSKYVNEFYTINEKKLDSMLVKDTSLFRSTLEEKPTAILVALSKNMSLLADTPDRYLAEILMIANIISTRTSESFRQVAIDYLKNITASLHPYGREIKDRISMVVEY